MTSPRPLLQLCLVAVLAVVGVSGWGWGWQQRQRVDDAEFVRRRVGLLDAENRRLSRALADQQLAAAATSEAPRRLEIERTVARLRGLKFLRPVVYKSIPRADLPAILRQKLAQQVPDQEFGNAGISLAALGLLPAGIDLKKTYLDLLGEQVGAFYDQHSAELFTFSGQSLENAQNRIILAHELTHALEDQQFHLDRLPLEVKNNDDRAIAASALVEGDATLVMSHFMLGDLSATALKDSLAGAFGSDMSQIAAAPRFLRETLLFPYLRGQEFCQALYQTGGWAALAEAFRRPPESSAEILHLERFLARDLEPPVTVEFPEQDMGGLKPVGNNVLGEFGTRQWLGKWLRDEGRAGQIASEWRADRYLVFGDAKSASYLWKSVWSSKAAAIAFEEATYECWSARYGLDPKALRLEMAKEARSDKLPNGHRLFIWQRGEQIALFDAADEEMEKTFFQLLGESVPAKPDHHVVVH